MYYRTYTITYETYTGLTEHILVFQNLDMYFRSSTCLTERIFILHIYTDLTELILITDVCSFGTPVGVIKLIQIQEYP